jgi:hypothetical protein
VSKKFRVVVTILTIATVTLAIAAAYVIDVEQGVNSQQPQIIEVFRKLNPDVLLNPIPWIHPLKNAIFGSTLFIGVCWITIATISLQKKIKKIMKRRCPTV